MTGPPPSHSTRTGGPTNQSSEDSARRQGKPPEPQDIKPLFDVEEAETVCILGFACATVSHMTDLRRLTLEATSSSRGIFGADYSVEVVWIDDETLHAALLDYGDSDDMGQGIDISEPARLLEWLVDDRFLGEWERFVAYCNLNDVGLAESPQGPPPEANQRGIPLTWAIDAVYAHYGSWGDSPVCYRVGDWRGLTLVLLRDRCEGRGSWKRLTTLLDDAAIESVERWRGYV